jgi:hypothetical protein
VCGCVSGVCVCVAHLLVDRTEGEGSLVKVMQL